MTRPAALTALTVLWCWPGSSQTTQALVIGRIQDAITGKALIDATVRYVHLATRVARETQSGPGGVYVLPLLSPGSYRIRVENGESYQPREAAAVEIPVAGLIQLDFELRPVTDLWEEGQYRSIFLDGARTSVNFYGPDVDFGRSGSFLPPTKQETRLDASVSTVITPSEVDRLPFPGRDVYTAIVLQPLVSSGTTTVRGLGLSVDGQRFGSGSYLLDGVDNNAYLITGPQVITPVEGVQEYRVSLANYSAEYGGTSGFVANAVTQSGLDAWHGLGYFYLMNDALDANDVTRRYADLPRAPFKQLEPGFRVGGPILPLRLFGSASLDHIRTRGYGPCQRFIVPATGVQGSPDSGGASAFLLATFRPSADTGCVPEFTQPEVEICAQCTPINIRPTESINRTTALARADGIMTGSVRLFGRLAISRLARPDFAFSPWPSFVSGFDQNASNLAGGVEVTRAHAVHEARISWGRDTLGFEPAHPELPLLEAPVISLPSSSIGAGFRSQGRTLTMSYSGLYTSRAHSFKAGGGLFLRNLSPALDATAGKLEFRSLDEFLSNAPHDYELNVSRIGAAQGSLQLPDTDHQYDYARGNLFVQDSWRAARRLVISAGLRYDYLGSPTNTGPAKDALVELALLPNPADRVAQARLPLPAAGDQSIYRADSSVWSLRSGVAYALRDDGRTVLRAGFGTFRDVIFENLWLNVQENQYESAVANLGNMPRDYLHPSNVLLQTLFSAAPEPGRVLLSPTLDSYRVIAFDPYLQAPLVKSGFAAVDQTISRNWHIEAIALRSASSHLLTTDDVNRLRGSQRPNPGLPPVFFRSSSGDANYRAFAVRAAYRSGPISLQASYTLSSSFDDQSDPLTGDFDLLRTQTQQGTPAPGEASFTREFHPETSYGHSDFDQRHNLVMYGIWSIPSYFLDSRAASLFRGWAVAGTAAIRSGTPFSIEGNTPTRTQEPLENNRANLVCKSGFLIDQALPDGRLLLNPNCFQAPAAGQIGNTARNAWYGPGAWNLDFSISRTFRPAFLPESSRISLRADAYNVLNHANLGNPETSLDCTAEFAGQQVCPAVFGQALYGRTERGSYFPAVKPFTETGRQIQLMLRFEF